MVGSAQHMQVADAEGFMSASRLLFGPIVQRFQGTGAPRVSRLVSTHLGVCRLSEIEAMPHVVFNDRARWRSFDPDSVKILMQLRGQSRFAQQSAVIDLSPTSAIIYDPVRTYSLENLSTVEQLILQVPRATFADQTLARLGTPVTIPSEGDALAQIVAGLMKTAIREAERMSEQSARRVGESLVQLVSGLIMEEPAGGRSYSPLLSLRERIVAFVDANLARNDLSADEIAARMGCSRRYLHKAFESESVTLDRWIWDRRLERSKEMLQAAGMSATISSIAFSCGFNSSAHFSRVFKKRFGVSPRELRETAQIAFH